MLADERTWFSEARFGVFVHFGLYTMLGGNENDYARGAMTREEYAAKLMPQFDPVAFDADEWVRLFLAAGARYAVLTTKHGEGFCLWDTAYTEFKATNTPFGRDIVKEFADGCHRHGLRCGLYFATDNWHYREPGEGLPEAATYPNYFQAQVRELMTCYGQVDEVWFDGHDERLSVDFLRGVIAMIHDLQPSCVVNDRGVNHSRERNLVLGDFVTPERQIPDRLGRVHPPVECCDAMGLKGWGYHADQRFWSAPELLRRLSKTASLGANYLLNVEPMPDGRIRPECVERLRAIGSWLETHRECVFGTQLAVVAPMDAGQMRRPAVGVATCTDRSLYLHLHEWPVSDAVLVPHLSAIPSGASLLGAGCRLDIREDREGVLITGLPSMPPSSGIAVIRLDFDAAFTVDEAAVAEAGRKVVTAAPGETIVLTPEAAEGTAEGGVPWHEINRFANGNTSVGHLIRLDGIVSWQVNVPQAGRFAVYIDLGTSAVQKDAVFTVTIADRPLTGKTVETGHYDTPFRMPLGTVYLTAGVQAVTLRIDEMPRCFSDIHRIVLQPVSD